MCYNLKGVKKRWRNIKILLNNFPGYTPNKILYLQNVIPLRLAHILKNDRNFVEAEKMKGDAMFLTLNTRMMYVQNKMKKKCVSWK